MHYTVLNHYCIDLYLFHLFRHAALDEDGQVIEEQELFTELASNEFLLHQLRGLLESGAQNMLEELPDGIHSGLARQGEQGIFFYFTAPAVEGRHHFWRYYDLNRKRILDNRFLITNLIACSPDTPRVVGDADVFAIQDKVIEDILASVQEQQALEAAPKILDPLQQTVITLLRGYLNSPVLKRADVRDAMQLLRNPMAHVSIRELRGAYDQYQNDQDIVALVLAIGSLVEPTQQDAEEGRSRSKPLSREDLHLVCFDFVWS